MAILLLLMPQIDSDNLNAPIQMIAELAADFIFAKEQFAAINAKFHLSQDLPINLA